jgi:hypothetical protein
VPRFSDVGEHEMRRGSAELWQTERRIPEAKQKILMIAEKKFRRLNSPELLAAVYDGQLFEDGMPVQETNPKRHAA